MKKVHGNPVFIKGMSVGMMEMAPHGTGEPVCLSLRVNVYSEKELDTLIEQLLKQRKVLRMELSKAQTEK